MFRIRKNSLLLIGTAFLAAVAMADATDHELVRLCSCDDLSSSRTTVQTTGISEKHEQENVTCPSQTSKNVSWHSWLVGDRRSKQFHYLDLLELLFRSEGSSSEGSPPSYE